MPELTLDLRKTVEQNAEVYFERAKKMRKKIGGAQEAITRLKKQLRDLKAQQEKEIQKAKDQQAAREERKTRHREWYERFRWFLSSDNILCVGGRDATTNEIIVKKHTDQTDIILHTEAPGSPFFVIKTQGKTVPETTLFEASHATALYSHAWKLGLGVADVYSVTPAQVSKTAPSGEFMPKGAFMIVGRRNYKTQQVEALAVGLLPDGRIMSGPANAVQKHCEKHIIITPGREKASDTAKAILKKLGRGDIDDIIATLPAGGCAPIKESARKDIPPKQYPKISTGGTQ